MPELFSLELQDTLNRDGNYHSHLKETTLHLTQKQKKLMRLQSIESVKRSSHLLLTTVFLSWLWFGCLSGNDKKCIRSDLNCRSLLEINASCIDAEPTSKNYAITSNW